MVDSGIQKKRGRPFDRLAYVVATGAGAGFSPIAPGTFGAAEGVLVYLGATYLGQASSFSITSQLIFLTALSVALFLIAVWSANRVCLLLGLKDPGKIVIDEVIGQLIALIPLLLAPSLAGILAGFILFRLFDIFKPYPIRRLESLAGGLGVVADDVLAGIYSAAVLWATVTMGLL